MHHRSFVLEATMIRTQYTTEDLKKLPLRAIAAFAARCARRVESIAQLPAEHPQREARRVAIDNAIRLAEEIARGSARDSSDPVVRALEATRAISGEGIGCECAAAAAAAAARTAATVWLVVNPGESDQDTTRWTRTPEARSFRSRLANDTAELVALDAFTAAVEAADAVAHNDTFMRGAIQDYERLLRLHLGNFPQAGQPIDSSPDGPLGPL
jgi:hypothetical protein